MSYSGRVAMPIDTCSCTIDTVTTLGTEIQILLATARLSYGTGTYGGSTSMTDELLTGSEVASLFRVNSKTVQRWARSGKLPSIQAAGFGGARRFRMSDIQPFLEVSKRSKSDG